MINLKSLINEIEKMPDPFNDPRFTGDQLSHFNTKEHAFGYYVYDNMARDHEWRYKLFIWGKTSIYTQIGALKIKGAL